MSKDCLVKKQSLLTVGNSSKEGEEMDICTVEENTKKQEGILGIDAGGTFTDLAFLSGKDLHVTAKVKTPTLHNNMAKTVERGIKKISSLVGKENIKTINIATTLATNAIVEHKTRKVALLLLGYDARVVEKAKHEFGTDKIFIVEGGHDIRGNEKAPLNEERVREVVLSVKGQVEGIAVSGFFSVRNPEHENRVEEIVKELAPELIVTCGHELATDLDAIKRATTVALNAGLIPIVMELLESVELICRQIGINATIAVVRGDGSLVSQTWAMEHPIEMVLSGPAASASGAFFLSKAGEDKTGRWVVDIGGTTTDIIYLQSNGKPGISKTGAVVGGHKTLVKAIDIYTFGLGGDSRVSNQRNLGMTIGPRRVKSLCSAAAEHEGIKEQLRQVVECDTEVQPLFAIKGRKKAVAGKFEERILKKLENGPMIVDLLLQDEGNNSIVMAQLDDMETQGIVEYAGFTPTDALHVLGKLDLWDREVSCMGAELLLSEQGQSLEDFAKIVCKNTVNKIVYHIYWKSLESGGLALENGGETEQFLYAMLGKKRIGSSGLMLKLEEPVVGIGAPSWAFMEQVGKAMGQRTILPKDAEVAGAVGAAVGSFSLQYAVSIEPHQDGVIRAHLPMGNADYEDLELAVKATNEKMIPWIENRAKKSGAKNPYVHCKREDETAMINGGLQSVYLGTKLYYEVEDLESVSAMEA